MNRNKFIINVTVIGIVLIILIPTIYTIIKKHNDRMLRVTYNRIEEAAEKCYIDGKCIYENITLKELYNNNYLEKESNPITKEYYNENSYVKRKGESFKFVSVD